MSYVLSASFTFAPVAAHLARHSSITSIQLEVRADVICSAAARRPLFIDGSGAPFNFCRRRRRKIFSGAPAAVRRPETPDPISHFLFSIFFTVLPV
jgi:hypothetical protein